MIVRIVRGQLEPGQLPEARRELADAGLLRGAWQTGITRPQAWIRVGDESGELVWLDFVETPNGAVAANGVSAAATLLAPILGDMQVTQFELDAPVLRETDQQPAILRLTVGRFSARGSDVQAQDLLRERLSSIGPEMTEAYVGRRILGRTIEVMFASLWTRPPIERPLDAPLWQDVTIHYDTYSVGVYRPLAGTE